MKGIKSLKLPTERYVYPLNQLLAQISYQPITWQQTNTFRHVDNLLKVSIRMRKKADSREFERRIVVVPDRLV